MSKRSQQIKEYAEEHWNKQSFDGEVIDFFSENMVFQTIIGKRVGKQNFLSHSEDWAHAFPDIQLKAASIEEFDNTVHVSFLQTGTHLNQYRDNETHKHTILSSTGFLNDFQASAPNMKKTEIIVDWIFVFDRDQVVRLFGSSDETDFNKQLGLQSLAGCPYSEQRTLKTHLNALLHTTLSSREMDCLALVFIGSQAKYAADLLRISYRTVETHLQNAYQKLGCSRQDQCLELMVERRILPLWQDLSRLLLMTLPMNKIQTEKC